MYNLPTRIIASSEFRVDFLFVPDRGFWIITEARLNTKLHVRLATAADIDGIGSTSMREIAGDRRNVPGKHCDIQGAIYVFSQSIK